MCIYNWKREITLGNRIAWSKSEQNLFPLTIRSTMKFTSCFFLITRRVCQHSPVGAVALHVRFTKKKNNKIIFREILYKRKNRPSKTNFSLFTRYRSLEKVYTDGKILHDLWIPLKCLRNLRGLIGD